MEKFGSGSVGPPSNEAQPSDIDSTRSNTTSNLSVWKISLLVLSIQTLVVTF
jgi:hypothetical protein